MPDPFRSQYRELNPEERARIDLIKKLAGEMHELMQMPPYAGLPGGREMALARTKLEESVMWATKAITG
jgi:hypothetical protein